MPGVEPPEPTRLGEVVWLEPYPDELLDPEARYEQSESVSPAFVTALQTLPPRQAAVLILRDVLGFPAVEVADMLEASADAVTSALTRARAGLRRRLPPAGERPPAPGSRPEEALVEALVEAFVRAYESAGVDARIALIADDVFMSMPPMDLAYEGLDVVGASARASSARAAASRSYRPARTASRRSASTPTRRRANATARAPWSSPSPATESAP